MTEIDLKLLLDKEKISYERVIAECHRIDKTFLWLSAGAIVLSITFCSALKGGIDMPYILGLSWLLLIICIFAVLWDMHYANLKEIEQHYIDRIETRVFPDLESLDENSEYRMHFNNYKRHAAKLKIAGTIAQWGFVTGILLLAIFAYFNLDNLILGCNY
jgi:hypothetical protein